MTGRIYIIKNTVNDKVYIGQTHVTVRMRFLNHLSAARMGKDYVIGKAMRKHGIENFYVDTLEEVTLDDKKEFTKVLNEKEMFWISKYQSNNPKYGYNMSVGGNVVRTTKELDEFKILELFDSGMPAFSTAKSLHVGVSKVTKILKEHNRVYGIEKQKRADEKEIVNTYVSGKNTMDICRKFNVNKSTVRRILLRNNIKLRYRAKNKNSERNPQTL